MGDNNINEINNTASDYHTAPVDGDVIISVNPSCSEAFMILYGASNGGKEVDYDRIMSELKKIGIVHGIDSSAINQAIHSRNFENQTSIAKWTAPVEGKNGTIKYSFSKTTEAKPIENAKGFVDYKDLGIIRNITSGTVIAEISFPTEGTPGTDLKGNSVAQRPGVNAVFGLGSNTELTKDGSKIIASVSGNLVYRGGAFCVDTVVTIKGDVDSSVGNIDFIGDIVIRGEVCEGFKVSSMQNITVMGNVTGCTIEAGKNVTIKKGCINSKVIAHGDAVFGFCEHSNITCDGSVTAQNFVICTVYCGQTLIAKDARGSLMGGKYTCLKGAECQNIGSKNYTLTELCIGDNAILAEEKSKLEKAITEIDTKILRCNQIVDFLSEKKKAIFRLPEDKEELLGSSVRSRVMLGMEKKKNLKRIAEIELALQQKQYLAITCKGTVYPGVRVTINDCVFKFESETVRCKIYLDELGDIVTAPL